MVLQEVKMVLTNRAERVEFDSVLETLVKSSAFEFVSNKGKCILCRDPEGGKCSCILANKQKKLDCLSAPLPTKT